MISAEFDKARNGFWFDGLGFGFFARRLQNGNFKAICRREGDPLEIAILIKTGGADVTPDVFATMMVNALRKYWPLDDAIKVHLLA